MWIGIRSGVMVMGLLTAAAMVSDRAVAQAPKGLKSPAGTIPSPGANSFSESQARQLVRDRGYTDVSPLVNDRQGIWRGTARNGTNRVQISVDYKGNVNAIPE